MAAPTSSSSSRETGGDVGRLEPAGTGAQGTLQLPMPLQCVPGAGRAQAQIRRRLQADIRPALHPSPAHRRSSRGNDSRTATSGYSPAWRIADGYPLPPASWTHGRRWDPARPPLFANHFRRARRGNRPSRCPIPPPPTIATSQVRSVIAQPICVAVKTPDRIQHSVYIRQVGEHPSAGRRREVVVRLFRRCRATPEHGRDQSHRLDWPFRLRGAGDRRRSPSPGCPHRHGLQESAGQQPLEARASRRRPPLHQLYSAVLERWTARAGRCRHSAAVAGLGVAESRAGSSVFQGPRGATSAAALIGHASRVDASVR